MKKIALLLATASLSACMGTAQPVAVTQNDTLSMACAGSPHMQTLGNLPVRCGPQSAKPYSFQ